MDWTDDDWERLGVQLREAREARGLSRRVLAEETGVSEKAIQMAEEGRVPSARWPKSVDTIAEALGWTPDSARAVLEGGSPRTHPASGERGVATDALARRMADNQIRMTVNDLTRDAERLAMAARVYADEMAEGKATNSGSARRLAQEAAELARRAERLDGMRDIAGLIPAAT
jgi:transcriptional regulator with XRE-family HTH domain